MGGYYIEQETTDKKRKKVLLGFNIKMEVLIDNISYLKKAVTINVNTNENENIFLENLLFEKKSFIRQDRYGK